MIFYGFSFTSMITLCSHTNGQCTAVGPDDGNSFGNDATVGNLTWSNTANAKTSNNQFASVSIFLVALSSKNTEYLTAEDFGFSIPSTASICGIEVDVERDATGILGALGVTLGSVSDNSVKIIKGGVIGGTEHASASPWTTLNSYTTYGGAADTWGIGTWLPADINASNFGVAISANIAALVGVTLGANIDHIRITVNYIDPSVLSLSLQDFFASKRATTDFISWDVSPGNDFSKFIVQRSADMMSWEDMVKVSAISGKTQYSSIDEYPLDGINYYRLQMLNKDGRAQYSPLQSVWQQVNNVLSIYPNPASSYIFIKSVNTIHFVAIRDMEGRTVKFPQIPASSGYIQLPIADLPQGLYVLQVDSAVYRFLKK